MKRILAALFILISLSLNMNVVLAQDSSFIFTTRALEPYHRSYLGNGVFSIATSRLGTDRCQSFMAWVYDQGERDIPRIANLPAWNEINVFNGTQWLNDAPIDSVHIQSFHQILDMYDGTVSTSYEWTQEERRIAFNVETFVSRARRNLAVVKLTMQPRFSGKLKVDFPLEAWPAVRRLPLAELDSIHYGAPDGWPEVWYPGHMTALIGDVAVRDSLGIMSLVSTSDGRNTTVAQTATLTWPPGLQQISIDTSHETTGERILLSFEASAGSQYTFCKYVAVNSSHDNPAPLEEARRASASAWTTGYGTLLREHADAWHQLWQTDIVVDGYPEFQKVVHSMIFYLLSSVREGTDFAIPPMGLSSAGYYGHIFWDSDTWMFPALVVMHPDIARSMVMFRYRTLNAALQNARRNGHSGAMYPWESDELGDETTPRFAYQNALYENHVVGDVALAQWQYFLATGDTTWLRRYGYDVMKETANFWAHRATYSPGRGRYEITKVVSVDEGLIGIGNDTYTNVIARKTLELAERASHILQREPDPLWHKIAASLVIPYDSAGHFYPPYENAPSGIPGSVSPLLSYPLGLSMDDRTKRIDLEHAIKRTEERGPGAMMTVTLYPVVAAEMQDRQIFEDAVPESYQPYLKPPFNVLSETPRSNAINFLTGAGGFLQQVEFGYTGLRLSEEGLVPSFKPMLPGRVTKLTLRNFSVHGRRYTIEVGQDSARFHPE